MSKNQFTGTAKQPQCNREFCQFNKDQYCNRGLMNFKKLRAMSACTSAIFVSTR